MKRKPSIKTSSIVDKDNQNALSKYLLNNTKQDTWIYGN